MRLILEPHCKLALRLDVLVAEEGRECEDPVGLLIITPREPCLFASVRPRLYDRRPQLLYFRSIAGPGVTWCVP